MGKKILFLINSLGAGGAEKVFKNQLKMLSENGYDARLFTLYGDLGFKRFMDWRGMIRLYWLVKKEGVSIIYSTLEEANLAARVLKIFIPRLKIVIREANHARIKSYKFKLADILLNFFTYRITAVSEGVANSLISYQPFHKRKIRVVPNGVEIPKVDYDDVFKGKQEGVITILNVGSLTPQKNQLELLKVFLSLKENLEIPLKLLIAGEGSEREKLENFISENGLSESVELLGLVDFKEMSALYLRPHIFVLNSLWEGSPNALLEAMSYGLPVISTATSGAVDIVEDTKSGLLIPINSPNILKEKIAKLAQDKKMRYDMGLSARATVKEKYSLNNNIEKLIEALN